MGATMARRRPAAKAAQAKLASSKGSANEKIHAASEKAASKKPQKAKGK